MTLIALPLGLLWFGAVLAALLDRRRRLVAWGAVVVLAAACAALLALAIRVGTDGPVEVVAGGWPRDVGIVLRADGLGTPLALVSLGVVLAALVHAQLGGRVPRLFAALTLFLATGLVGLFLTGDVFSFYVFFELAMISAYVLAATNNDARTVPAAFIFAVVNLLGSFLFLIAVAALYRATGTLEMLAIARRADAIDPNTAVVIAVLFFVAFGVKLGLFPFHFWLPSVYAAAPPAVAAILAGALANIGAYGFLRFGAGLLPREVALGGAVLVGIGAVSVIYGAIQAVGRRDPREVLAYSAIGHAGYVLVALGVGGAAGLAAAVAFTAVNAIGKALLFLAVDLRGPLVGAAFALGAFSVAGVPPAAGFYGKAALLDAGVQAGSPVAVALLLLGGALSFVYLFQIYQHEHWRPRPERAQLAVSPVGARAVVAVVAVLVLAVGLWPEPLLALSAQAAQDLRGMAVR